MKQQLIILMCAAVGVGLSARDLWKSVTVTTPGELESVYTAEADTAVQGLRLAGTLNSKDVKFLRRLCGVTENFQQVEPRVTKVDLRGVMFDATDTAAFAGSPTARITGEHVLPGCMFSNCSIDSLILPDNLKGIEDWALQNTRLRYITIPKDVPTRLNAVCYNHELVELRFLCPMGSTFSLAKGELSKLRRVTFGDVDYVASRTFYDLPALEEVTFEGTIGHIDGCQFKDSPQLKRVTYNGPVALSGGPLLFEDCPAVESVDFNDLVLNLGFTQPEVHARYGALDARDATQCRILTADSLSHLPQLRQSAEAINAYLTRTAKSRNFLCSEAIQAYNSTLWSDVCEAYNLEMDEAVKELAWIPQALKEPKLETLKKSAPYKASDTELPRFTYAPATDSLLAVSRTRFNLDSIAGTGPDSERIKRLLYWVHDTIRHDGSSAWPTSQLTLGNIIDHCRKNNCGVNCRMMAIALADALLAEGIPARYLTCQPMLYDMDQDCHVICVAWARDLDKWVWADPTFAAYVTDENGLWLHPGEVRSRLINDQPLVLNPDSNWNHEAPNTQEHYLGNYMAKNLYLITANLNNGPAPEGTNAIYKPQFISLIPSGFSFPSDITTSDDARFWVAPE